MDVATTVIMTMGASMSIGALVSYFKKLTGKSTELHVKVGEVEISVRGPISDNQANEIVRAIRQAEASRPESLEAESR